MADDRDRNDAEELGRPADEEVIGTGDDLEDDDFDEEDEDEADDSDEEA